MVQKDKSLVGDGGDLSEMETQRHQPEFPWCQRECEEMLQAGIKIPTICFIFIRFTIPMETAETEREI